jgi:hypothetical protein
LKRHGDIEAVLRKFIQHKLFTVHRGPCEARVVERQKDGKAEISCALPAGALCIEWNIEKDLFPFLKSNECTDGAFLVERPDGSFDAHILECKITINQDSRSKAKAQMAWTLVRVLALAGVLGARVHRAILYTAYCQDRMDKSPGLAKLPLGRIEDAEEDAEVVDALRGQFDWPERQVELRGFDERFVHHAIRLTPPDQEGEPARGKCTLASS